MKKQLDEQARQINSMQMEQRKAKKAYAAIQKKEKAMEKKAMDKKARAVTPAVVHLARSPFV